MSSAGGKTSEGYGDDWWCSDWRTGFASIRAQGAAEQVAFLSPEVPKTGKQESDALVKQRNAEEYLGSQLLDCANPHPADPDVPESLYLTLRMIRYGCNQGRWGDAADFESEQQQVETIRKNAARLLRQKYAGSPWTMKAAPFVE